MVIGGMKAMCIMDTISFVQNAKEVHGDDYIYTKSEYIDSKTKVCIICPKHGEFWQKPYKHLCGQGCLKCYNERRKNILRLTNEVFKERSFKIHGNKYIYDKIEYDGASKKVCIICPEHGEFWQTPNNHLSGHGCPKCAIKESHKFAVSNTYEFIAKSKLVHGDKYDYSKVEYVNNKTKVCIICPEHGEFWQRPNDHLTGYGCPKCSLYTSKAEKEICELLNNIDYEQNDRTILGGKEIDIYIPSLKLGIEYD